MGSRKTELGNRNTELTERAREISEVAETKSEEAEHNRQLLDSIEAADEDTRAALEDAYSACAKTGSEISQRDIEQPGQEVNENFGVVSEKALEASEQESKNAEMAVGATSNYQEIGSNLSSEMTRSSEEFTQIHEYSDEKSDEMRKNMDDAISRISSAWEV